MQQRTNVRQNDMIKIRKAALRDAGDVSRIVCSCYEGFGQTDGYPSDVIAELKEARGSEECIRHLITHEDMFVADDDGHIRGNGQRQGQGDHKTVR